MKDFAVNLARRAAGLTPSPAPLPTTSPAPQILTGQEADLAEVEEVEASESLQVQTVPPAPPPETPRAAPKLPTTEPPSPPASGSKPAVPQSLLPEGAPPTRAISETREIVREVIHEAPGREIIETVREVTREIHEQTVVREEAAKLAEPERPRQQVAPDAAEVRVFHPAETPTTPQQVMREVVLEKPAPAIRPPSPPTLESQPLAVTELPAGAGASQPEPGEPSLQAPIEAPQSRPATRQPDAVPTKGQTPATPPPPPAKPAQASPIPLRPAPSREPVRLPPVVPPVSTTTRPPVEVRIGTIEIQGALPPDPPKPPEAAPSKVEPVEGFDAYRGLRSYAGWYRE